MRYWPYLVIYDRKIDLDINIFFNYKRLHVYKWAINKLINSLYIYIQIYKIPKITRLSLYFLNILYK